MTVSWTHATLHVGAALYAVNLCVGLSAQIFETRFGAFHHWLYAVVFAGAVAATVFAFHPALLVTIAALAALPLTKPRTPLHPTLAIAGSLGYVGAYLI